MYLFRGGGKGSRGSELQLLCKFRVGGGSWLGSAEGIYCVLSLSTQCCLILLSWQAVEQTVCWLTQERPGIGTESFPNVCTYTDYPSLSAKSSYLLKSINVLQ